MSILDAIYGKDTYASATPTQKARRTRKNPPAINRSYESLLNEARDALQQDVSAYQHQRRFWSRDARFVRLDEGVLIAKNTIPNTAPIKPLQSIAARHGFKVQAWVRSPLGMTHVTFAPLHEPLT